MTLNRDRRRLMKQSLGLAGGLMAGLRARSLIAATPVKKHAADRVLLGKTGIEISRLAIGTGTHGVNKTSVQGRLGINGFADMLCHAYDQGLRFWETADQYGTHNHLREGMRRVGRN